MLPAGSFRFSVKHQSPMAKRLDKRKKKTENGTVIISASVFLGDNLSQVACQKENLNQPKLQNKNSPKNNRNLMLSIWFLLTSCHLNLGLNVKLTAGEMSQFLSFSLLFAQRSEMIQWNNGNPKQWKNGDPKHYRIQTSPKEHTFSNIGLSMLLNSYLFKKKQNISTHRSG